MAAQARARSASLREQVQGLERENGELKQRAEALEGKCLDAQAFAEEQLAGASRRR